MIIPYTELSADALRGLIEEFVLREGTEYGARDHSLDAKVSEVERQLENGLAVIVYGEQLESCNVVARHHPAAQRQ